MAGGGYPKDPATLPASISFPPTGRRVTVPATEVFAFEDGRIKYSRHYWDMTRLLAQIGALPGAR